MRYRNGHSEQFTIAWETFKLWRGLLWNFFKSSSIQSSDERIEVSQLSMATLERETIECANLGGVNMRVVRGCHSRQLGSIASL